MTFQSLPAPRVSLRQTIRCRKTYARATKNSQLVNISTSGAFIAPLAELQPGDEINLEIRVSGRRRQIGARVVWCGRGGSGVQFIIGNGQDRQIVEDLVSLADEYRSHSQNVLEMIFNKVS